MTPTIEMTDVQDLSRRALQGDAEAVRELRRRGLLRTKPAQARYPASHAQKSLWLWQQRNPESRAYAMPFMVRMPAGISAEACNRALSEIVERHESLRTVFESAEGRLWQRVLPPQPVRAQVLDLSQRPDPRAAMLEAIREDLDRPFDLGRGPLIRFVLFALGGGGQALYANAHHIIFDGFSAAVLQGEIRFLCEAFAAGRPARLPALALQVKDHAAWQLRLLESERGQAMLEWWRAQLAGVEPYGLPLDFPRPSTATCAGRTVTFTLDADAEVALRAITRRTGCTAFNTLAFSLGALLARYAGSRDVTLGMPCACRTRKGTESLVGLLANPAALRFSIDPGKTFAENLDAAQTTFLDTLERQDYPFESLVEKLDIPVYTGRNPLFDVMVASVPAASRAGEELLPDPAELSLRHSKFDLVVTFEDDPNATKVTVEYNAELFLAERIERMAAHLSRLLARAWADPEAKLGEIDILPDAELRFVTTEVNATSRPYPSKSLAELFEETAARFPERTAVTGRDEAPATYAEINQRADAVADALRGPLAVVPGSYVGIVPGAGADMIVGLLGILKAQCAYMPVDVGLPAARIAFLIETANCPLVIATNREGKEQFASAVPGLPVLTVGELPEAPRRSAGHASPDSPCYLLFTSGSTGEPKGVAIPHKGVARLVLNTDYLQLTPEDRLLQTAPLAFDASTLEIWSPLLNGAHIRLTGKEDILKPGGLARLVAEHRATVLFLTTGLLHRMAEDAPETFGGLRVLITGGDVLNPLHSRRILETCPQVELLNVYGPTENSCITSTRSVTLEDTRGQIPIGKPIANSRVYVLDSADRPAPIGVWGEICAAGDGLAVEYVGRPDLTGQAFVELPALPGERLYRTGDVGRWRADGVLEFGGRRDAQVKIRGFRIEIEEIETALLRAPGVRQAAVVAIQRNGDKELAAFVRAETGDAGEWRRFLQSVLPGYMVPSRFMVLDEMPLTANGKPDRKRLAAMAPAGSVSIAEDALPRGETEKAIAAVFEEVLGRPVGRLDDFFHAGGHSLKAMQLLSRLEKRFQTPLALRDFFSEPTVEATSRRIRAASGRVCAEIPRAPEAADYSVSYAQRRLWILSRMEGGSRAYNVTGAWKVTGDFDSKAFQQALLQLSARHEILRSTFDLAEGEIRQTVHASLPPAVEFIDLTGEADPMAQALRLAGENAGRPFDLERGPLWRALELQTGPAERILFFAMHHIVSDGWSVNVLIREMEALYAALKSGREAAMPLLAIQYRDFAAWQTARVESDEDGHMAYWLKRLAQAPPPVDLPADRQRPRVQTFDGARLEFALPKELADGLKSVTGGGHSLFAALTALVKSLIHRYTGATDVLVGCPVAGREHALLEDQVGMYASTVVLRDEVRAGMPFADLASNVAQTIAESIEHQSAPFDLLVEKIGVERDTSRPALFNVMVSLQNLDRKPPSFAGSPAEVIELDSGTSQFDLTFDFLSTEEGLRVSLEYSTALFDASRMERLRDHFLTLAASAAAAPQTAVGRLRLLPEAELAQILTWGNEAEAPSSAAGGAEDPVTRFEALAAEDPDAPALVFDGVRLSRGEVNRMANGLAQTLLERGLMRGEPVALLLARSERAAWAAVGVAKAGGAFVFLDPSHPEVRIRQILEQAQIRFVVTESAGPEWPGAERILVADVARLDCGNPLVERRPEDLAYILFTSGSTGAPKGVLVERGSLANLMLQADEYMYGGLGSGLREAMSSAFIFDVAVQQVFASLSRGNELHVLPEEARHDPAQFLRYVERESVVVADTTPGFLSEILEEIGEGALPRSLRRLTVGNEALPWPVVERFYAAGSRSHVSLVNVYGPTECSVNATALPLDARSTAPGLTAPIGRPLPGARALILDPAGNPAPVGVPGEIVLSGAGVARGYLNQPELTAQRFVAHPFRPGERAYRTGDLGRFLEDGRIEFLGRLDEQLKVRGFRIEAGEIEHRLRQHPGVRAAAVGMAAVDGNAPDLAAWVVTAEGGTAPTPGELRAHLAAALPAYMIPAFFIPVPRFPVSAGGKADKRALARDYPPRSEAPETSGRSQGGSTEAQILEIWRSVLKSSTVGPETSFFEAGGNSLLIIRLHREIEKRFPGALTVTDLFSLPTVADQARRIDAGTTASKPLHETEAAEPKRADQSVAIIGMAVRLADYDDVDGLWTDLIHGVDRIRPFPQERQRDAEALLQALGWNGADPAYREMAFLDRVDLFDSEFFRLSPADAALLAPMHRIFIDTAWRAVEDAGYGGRRLNGAPVGVFAGGNASDSEFTNAAQLAKPEATEQIFAGNTASNMVTRLGYLMNWRGPAMLVDTACSSGLSAVHVACRALAEGECEVAVAGAAKTILLPVQQGELLRVESEDGRTRAFSDGSHGTGAGEGCVVVVLKPLSRAVADGDRILAVIRASAMNQDGASAGLTVPNADAQGALIREAWRKAGLDPSAMGYLEAHGTGTSLGDPIEIDGITRAVRPFSERRQFIAVGSVKTNFGHLDHAAGMLGLAKAILCIAREAIPPTLHFAAPNRAIRFEDSPLYVCDRLAPWPRSAEPRRCGVSGFGLSGINCHVVLEEPPLGDAGDQAGPHLLPLSALSDEGLRRLAKDYLYRLAAEPELARRPGDVCYTASVGRGHEGRRLALVFDSVAELREMLNAVVERGPSHMPASGMYHGAALRRQAGTAVESVVPTGSHRAALDRVAEQYASGLEIDWEALHRGRRRHSVTLPGSVLNRRRMWPDFRVAARRPAVAARTLPGPFLAALRAETPERAVYEPDLDPVRCWPLSEHRVSGTNVLVGTAFLQIALEAAGQNGIPFPLEVRDLFLGKLLAPAADTSVVVEVVHGEGSHALKVSSRASDGTWAKHAEAQLAPASGAPAPLHLESIRSRLSPVIQPVGESPRNDGPVEAGERWHCLRRAWAGDREMLGFLELPAAFSGDLKTYAAHPALLDAALHFALPLCSDARNLMPMSMARVRLFAPVPATVYSHARLLPGDSESSARFDVMLCDAAGNVIAAIDGYTLGRYKEPMRRPKLLTVQWSPAADSPKGGGPHRVALLLAPGQERTRLAQDLIETLSGSTKPALAGVLTLDPNPTDAGAEGCVREIVSMGADGVALLSPALTDRAATDLTGLERRLKVGVEACFLLVKALANHAGGEKRSLLLVGRGAFGEGAARPENAALAALARTVSQEYGHIWCRYLDIEEQTGAAAILEEFGRDAEPADPIALRGGVRMSEQPMVVDENAPGQGPQLQDGDVALVTGGLGGIGLALARRLAGQARVRIALLSRRGLPEREAWEEIESASEDPALARRVRGVRELEAAGAEVMVLAADVAERESLGRALATVRGRWGRIHAVLHCAGEAGDGFLCRKNLNEFRRVMRPKAQGTWLLDELTREDRPKLFFLCSSLTGVTGGPGQGDYAAANAFQDAWARFRKSNGWPALSLAWCAWAETGMAFDRGVADARALKTSEALDVFDRALGRPEPVLLVDEGPAEPPRPLAPASLPAAVTLTGRAEGRYSQTEQTVAAIWAGVLGYESIDVAGDFFRMGGDSINALRIRNEAVQAFGLEISIADLFSHPTPESYAAFIDSKREQTDTGMAPRKSVVPRTADRPLYPLSIPQRWMYRLWEDAPEQLGWNLPEVWELRGALDIGRLEDALRGLLERHESLRARFRMEAGEVRQSFDTWEDFQLPVETAAETEIEERAREFVRPFHLLRERLFRSMLLRIAPDRHVLCLDIHHAAADGMSMGILGRELAAIYQGERLPDLPARYRDYAVWQDERLASGELEPHVSYWAGRFAGDVPRLNLPLDIDRPSRRAGQGSSASFEVSGPAMEGVQGLAQESGATPFAVFFAAVAALLRRLSGQDDLLIEVSDHGRTTPEIQDAVGMFVGALPVRVEANGEWSVVRLVQAIRARVAEATEHREAPASLLSERMRTESPVGRSRMADVAISYMAFGDSEDDRWAGWDVRPLQVNVRRSSVADLKFYVTERRNSMLVVIEYDSGLFLPATVERFGNLLLAILRRMAAEPNAPVGSLGGQA